MFDNFWLLVYLFFVPSVGAIAGIAVGGTVFVGGVAGGVYYVLHHTTWLTKQSRVMSAVGLES